MKRVNKILESIKRKLSRKEIVKVPKEWLDKHPPQTSSKSNVVTLEVSKPRGKIKLFWLRPFKRGLAAILLVIDLATSLMAISVNSIEGSLIFLPNAFILMDYLWKTRVK